MALAPAELHRLAALCGLFGSDHVGERATAAAMADRFIRDRGLSWQDVLRPEAPPPAPVPPATTGPRYWKDTAESCLFDHSGALNEWETKFLQDVLSRGYALSERQEAALRRIAAKTGRASMVGALDRELWVTTFDDTRAIYRASDMLSLRALLPRLRDTRAPSKQALPLIKLCSFGDQRTAKNSLRFDRNVREIWGVEADYDGERLRPEEIAEALRRHGLAGVVVTSPSHREDAPRARILLPCSTPLRAPEREKLVSRLAGVVPDALAAESWTLSQSYFIGRVGEAPSHRVLAVDGDFIDLRPDLDAAAKPRPVNGHKRKPGTLVTPDLLPLDAGAALAAIGAGNGSHDALLRLAGRLAGHGVPRADIAAVLAAALHQRPETERDAGWHQAVADLPRLIRWVEDQESAEEAKAEVPPAPPPAPPPPPPTGTSGAAGPAAGQPAGPDLDLDTSVAPAYSDEALALAFAEQHSDRLRFVATWNAWHAWDGKVWNADDTLRVFSRVRLLLRQAAASCPKRRLRTGIASARTVAAVEKLARADRRLAATITQWDRDPDVLNTPAGLIDLRTGALHPHRPAAYATRITAAAPGGECPAWQAFLARITGDDRELQAFLQRAAGYCLAGHTVDHVLFFGFGTGANGKSTFLNTLTGMMGSYATIAAMETFTASPTDQHPCDLAMLRGARLVVAQETADGKRWAESRIKAMTGGDPITARFMRQDFFTFAPNFKLFIAGNHRPGLRSVDEATRRRVLMVPFSVTIPPAERDKNLPAKLRTEWGGILAWAIEGCLEWRRIGLAPPRAVLAASAEYFAAEDLIQAWIDECCDLDKARAAYTDTLYGSFKAWAELAGEHVPAQRVFVATLADRGFRRDQDQRHGRHRRTVVGLILKSGGGTVPP